MDRNKKNKINSKKFLEPLTESENDACPKKESSLRKGEIQPHYSFYRSTERNLFHVAASSEHMADKV